MTGESGQKPDQDSGNVSLLGISLHDKPKWLQLSICAGGFFFGYLVNGVVEEYVYNHLRFSFGWYFSIIHASCYLVLIYLSGFRLHEVQNSWSSYVQMSAVLAGSHGLTKSSLAYLNYPAQLMFKSTKVLPVMMLGAFIPGLKRKYSLRDYIAAVLLVMGLILFTLADATSSPIFSVIGVIMVCGALVLDALVGNLQEAIFTVNPRTTQTEMLFCSSVLGIPMLFIPCLLSGELVVAFFKCLEHPFVYGVLVFEACATFVGQMAVLSLVILFGAATTAMVTTARKAVTLLISYILFSKPFSWLHLVGLVLVAGGIYLKMIPSGAPKLESTEPLAVPLEKVAVSDLEEDHEKAELIPRKPSQ